MTDSPEWPPYPVGPKDSVFAVGVATTRFAALEIFLQIIFARTFDLEIGNGMMIAAKLGCEATVSLIRRKMPILNWPPEIAEAVEHFLAGLDNSLFNRNNLAHSLFGPPGLGNEAAMLFKQAKMGHYMTATPTLEELRQVSDEMEAFQRFGEAVARALAYQKHVKAALAAFPWPDKPPLPRRLDYS